MIKDSVFFKVLKGKSITKANFNMIFANQIKEKPLKGLILDLGSGRLTSYQDILLEMKPNIEVISVNLNEKLEPDIIASIETSFPFKNEIADSILAFNLLEHLYDFDLFLKECHRILKEKGELYIFVPFLHRIHSDPDDYFRYTDSALRKMLISTGFSNIEIIYVGYGPLTAVLEQLWALFSRVHLNILFAILSRITITIDKLIANASKTKNNYPLGYFCIARK